MRFERLLTNLNFISPLAYSAPLLPGQLKTRLEACIFGLKFLSDLANRRGTSTPLASLVMLQKTN